MGVVRTWVVARDVVRRGVVAGSRGMNKRLPYVRLVEQRWLWGREGTVAVARRAGQSCSMAQAGVTHVMSST